MSDVDVNEIGITGTSPGHSKYRFSPQEKKKLKKEKDTELVLIREIKKEKKKKKKINKRQLFAGDV